MSSSDSHFPPLRPREQALRDAAVIAQDEIEALRSTVAIQGAAIDRLLRFLLKAGFVLPQHAAERDRLIEEIEGTP